MEVNFSLFKIYLREFFIYINYIYYTTIYYTTFKKIIKYKNELFMFLKFQILSLR